MSAATYTNSSKDLPPQSTYMSTPSGLFGRPGAIYRLLQIANGLDNLRYGQKPQSLINLGKGDKHSPANLGLSASKSYRFFRSRSRFTTNLNVELFFPDCCTATTLMISNDVVFPLSKTFFALLA